MYCSKCGANNNENANFCAKCGFALKKPSEVNTQVSEPMQNNIDNFASGYVNNYQSNDSQYVGYTQNNNNGYNNGVQYGGFGLRLVALLIDGTMLTVINLIVMLIVFSLLNVSNFGNFSNLYSFSGNYNDMPTFNTSYFISLFTAYGIVGLLEIIINWLYYALMESSKHQATLGKMALGLIVTDMNGQKISFGRASGRYFGKMISGMTMYIGYLMAAFTQKQQALHDMIAGTLVIKKNN